MVLSRRSFNRGLAGAGASSLGLAGHAATPEVAKPAATPSATPNTAAFSGPSLDALARAKGLRFGNAMGTAPSGARKRSRFHDLAYRELTARECSVIVAENETKWPQLRPTPQGPYQFGPADEIFNWAVGLGMLIRGHTLLWSDPKWLPDWVNQFKFGSQPRQAAEALLAEHVRSTCSHFGRRIESWDVLNEAVVPETGELRRNVFSQHIGAIEHMAQVFHLAREHAPHAQLVYNDFMSWGAGNAKHRSGVLKLLAELKARGAPVQALGLQAHVGVWSTPTPGGDGGATATEWRRFLDEVMGMGLDLLITEFDVNDRALPSDIHQRDIGVAAAARDWLDVTLASPRLNRFLCWGLADHYSWLQDNSPRADGLPKRPLPYDEQLRAKPLRQAIADALRAMPARPAA